MNKSKPFTFYWVLSLLLTSGGVLGAKCELTPAMTATTAAAGMVAGYTGVRQYVATSDIEKMSTRFLYNFRAPDSYNVNAINRGEQVTIRFSNDSHLWQLQDTHRQFRRRIHERTHLISVAEEQLRIDRTHNNTTLIQKNLDWLDHLKEERTEAQKGLQQNIQEMNQVKKVGTTKLILNESSAREVAFKLDQLNSARAGIYSIERLPRNIATQLRRVTNKNGFILVSTVLALGLVSAEEFMSGRIKCSIENELKNL